MDLYEILLEDSIHKRQIIIDFGVIVHHYWGWFFFFKILSFSSKNYLIYINYTHLVYIDSTNTDLAGDALKIGCFKYFICNLCIFPMICTCLLDNVSVSIEIKKIHLVSIYSQLTCANGLQNSKNWT